MLGGGVLAIDIWDEGGDNAKERVPDFTSPEAGISGLS